MRDFQKEYRDKLITPQELVGLMKPGNAVQLGVWYGHPYGAIDAIGKYGREIDPLYITGSFATGPWEYMNHPGVYVMSGFLGPFERASQKAHNNVYFTPTQYTDGQRVVREGREWDFFIYRVAPMDERGIFNFSLTASWEYNAIRYIRENRPNTKVVFEVNPNMPKIFGLPELGNNELSIDYCDLIIEDSAPLMNFPVAPPNDIERAIARNVATLVEDKATIQLGFGTIPMAIGKLLEERKDLGIHTEMFCDGHVDLIEAGSVTNAHKGLYDGISIATFALGQERMRNWVKENPKFAVLPVEEINAVPVIARVKKLTSINSALTIDLTGQACAHCLGSQTYSGLGGAFEFAYGAQLSPGGKSVLCLPSMTTLKDGREVSNILAQHPLGTRITLPEHCTDWVVTEYGAVRVKFLCLEQRAAALIDIAHPKFREELAREAADNGLRMNKVKNLPNPPARFFSRAS